MASQRIINLISLRIPTPVFLINNRWWLPVYGYVPEEAHRIWNNQSHRDIH